MGRGKRGRNFLTFVFLLTAMSAPVTPARAGNPGDQVSETAEGHEAGFHRNHFAGIIGWSRADKGEDSVTFGMEYSRWFTPRISLAVYLEMSEGDFAADSIGMVVGARVFKSLKLFAGPGRERTLFDQNEYLARVGLDYSFRLKGLSVAPVTWVDFVAGHEIYFLGVAIGTGF